MAGIEGEIIIARPVDVVFDYVADQSNEPQYNPQMVRAEKITAGPVGKGTRFRSAVASMGRTAEMLIECTGYDRPKLFATTTTMRQADISYTLRFDPAGGGHPDAVGRGSAAQGCVPAAGPTDHLAGKPPGAADLGQPETALGTGLMVGVEILARAAWSCLSGDSTRPRALARVVVAHDAMRA